MLKKLFGKKKEPLTFDNAREELLESIKEESLNRNAVKNLDILLSLSNEENESNLGELVSTVFQMAKTLPMPQFGIAMSACATFFEQGFGNERIADEIVSYYLDMLQGSKPFFDMLSDMVKKGEEGESDIDVDVDSLYQELMKDRNLVSESLGESVVKVDHFSRYMISILSIDSSLISKYKDKLIIYINSVKDCFQSFYWLDRLFNLLFDEPVLVIDVDNHIGFEGKMNGVSDNYQLQYLLMSLPELDEQPQISGPALTVVNGKGPQVSNIVAKCKWNMYNLDIIKEEDWTDIKIGPAKTMELQDFWIWGEGTPSEISIHNGRRVILLGRSPIERTTRIQRIFKNVEASVEVERMLTDEEINKWLGLSD